MRFSSDKTPYKSNVGIIFWDGPRKRMESPGFYLHLEPDSLMLAGGLYMIPRDLIDPYRKTVSEEGPARELKDIIGSLKDSGIEIGGLHYKKVPRGFSAEHPHSDLLRYNGVYGMRTTGIPQVLFDSSLVDETIDWFRRTDQLNRWFLKYLY